MPYCLEFDIHGTFSFLSSDDDCIIIQEKLSNPSKSRQEIHAQDISMSTLEQQCRDGKSFPNPKLEENNRFIFIEIFQYWFTCLTIALC